MAHFWPIRACARAISRIIYDERLLREQEKRLLGILMNAFARSKSPVHFERKARCKTLPEHETFPPKRFPESDTFECSLWLEGIKCAWLNSDFKNACSAFALSPSASLDRVSPTRMSQRPVGYIESSYRKELAP